jgi:predicted porin
MKRVQVNKISKKFFLNALLFGCVGGANAADVDSSFYGSLRLGADYVDSGTVDDAANGRDYLSRVGVNAKVQLSEGLTGLGKIEYGLRGDDGVNFNQNQKAGMRQVYVGLKGKFGTVTYGSQTILWHQYVRSAYFSDALDSLRQGAIRDDDMLQWQKSYNNWKFGAAIQTEQQDGDSIDQYQVAAQYHNQKLKLQAALASDEQGENTGNLYGVRAWYNINEAFTVSAFYQLAEQDFDLYKGNSSGNVRLVSAKESGKIGGVTACADEERSTTGIYGKWRQGNNQVHARYAVNACEIKGDVSSIKVEYIRYFSKQFRLWASFEQLDSDTSRLPATAEDMSEVQLGARFDF